MVRLPLLTQACRDENVVDTRACRPSPPQNAALDKTRGNGFQFVQALKVTMGLHDIIKQICHHFFFLYKLCDAKHAGPLNCSLIRRIGHRRKSEDTITATAARQAELPLPVNEDR
jgi:hypothetical protein